MTLLDALAVVAMAMLGGSALSCLLIGTVLDETKIAALSAPLAGLLCVLIAVLAAVDWVG